MDTTRLSKRLSYVLRHAPQSVGLTLEPGGWVDVELLLSALAAHGAPVGLSELERVVSTSDKQRFAFDEGKKRIRAQQGHSVPVELGYAPQTPPPVLFHGTAARTVEVIMREGLRPGRRHAVHLSPDEETARRVGQRRGAYAILRVDAAALAASGVVVTRTPNGVWLVDAVPPEFLTPI